MYNSTEEVSHRVQIWDENDYIVTGQYYINQTNKPYDVSRHYQSTSRKRHYTTEENSFMRKIKAFLIHLWNI